MNAHRRTAWSATVALVAGLVVAVTPSGPAAAATTFVAVDRAAALGLYANDKSWASAVVDYDSDGDEDVWIGFHQWSGKLFRNDGGSYTRVAADAWPRVNAVSGKVTDRHDCTFADVDLDGRPDAYCSGGRNESNLVKTGMENGLWLQLSPGQFTDVGIAWGVGDVCGRGRHVTFLNVNGDAYPDLFVGNSVPRTVSDRCDDTSQGLPDENSKIFINNNGTSFTQLPDSGISIGVGERCAERIDYDHDGWDDLATCRFRNQPPKLFHNVQGRFVDVSTANGLTQQIVDIVVSDLNGDGWDDLVTGAPTGFAYRLNQHGSFGPQVAIGVAGPGGEGRSVAVGDADGDGDLDVYGLQADLSGATNPNDALFINDNLTFTRQSVPPAAGNGDEVRAIHPYGGTRADFLVLNGADPAGPVQVIELVPSGTVNSPPKALFAAPTCTLLSCTFDASGSTDSDGQVTGVAWTFGDSQVGSGSTTQHTFATAGTYVVTATVTDDGGSTGVASQTVTVAASSGGTAIAFRGATGVQGTGKSIAVAYPAGVQAGDVALLVVSTNAVAPVSTAPAPWVLLRRVTDSSIATNVWWRTIPASGSGSVTVSSTVGALHNAQLLVYSGVAAQTPVATGVAEPTLRAGHPSPTATAATGDWVVWHWADKSSSVLPATWTLPPTVAQRMTVVPTATTYRVTSVTADSGHPVAAGPVPSVTAVAGYQSNLATMWSVVLHQAP